MILWWTMSNPTWIHGRIEINPPLSWRQIKDSPYLRSNARKAMRWPDAVFDVTETEFDTAEGLLTKCGAIAIIPDEGIETSARTLLEDVEAIVTAYPEHTFTGYFQCEGEENSDLWRVVIRDGHAERVDAMIVWPEGSE